MHPTSKFLPDDFNSQPIGLIAGKGLYPILMAERILAAGIPLRLISFLGETEQSLIDSTSNNDHLQVKVGQLGKLLKSLKKLGCKYAVMAGQISPKRLFHGLHPDLKALAILNRLKIKNAETIFGAIATEIEAIDIKMLDARCFLDDQLASKGLMTLVSSKHQKSSSNTVSKSPKHHRARHRQAQLFVKALSLQSKPTRAPTQCLSVRGALD